MNNPVTVAITGAAGQIGYQLCFRIAAGDMLGPDQPVILKLLEIAPAMDALNGVVMELRDAALPLLNNVVAQMMPISLSKTRILHCLLAPARVAPAWKGADLLEANGKIFGPQGKALNEHASRAVKVLVVGNPANTNALIAQASAPDLDPANFTAMTRLDHNRAMAQLAEKTGTHHGAIQRMLIWGKPFFHPVPGYSLHPGERCFHGTEY